MVHFVGAGCGAADLITVRGARLLSEADVIIYAGSLVNPALLDYAKPGCEIHDSAYMTLEEVLDVIKALVKSGMTSVIVTHEMGFAREVSDRILFMGGGVIAESGKPDELMNNPQNPRTKEFLSKVLY